MTLTQFFFHLEQDKKIIIPVENNEGLFFFQLNSDLETVVDFKYTGAMQEGLEEALFYGFTRNKLEELIGKHPNILEDAFIAELEVIEGKATIWDKIKFFFLRRFY